MRLRVVSLNVWALPAPIGRFVEERVDLILRELPGMNCDVALFQEVWRDEVREQMREGGRRAGFDYHWWRPGPASGGSGLLALSRLPIDNPRFRPFTLCGLPQRFTQMDYYSGKGVALFTVRPGGQPVVLCNTHLHARYAGLDVEDDYIGHRSAEVIEIADELRTVRDPIIAAGDFNMRDVAPEYELLGGMTGLTDVAAALDARRPTSMGDNPWRRDRGSISESRIDYVFDRDGTQAGIVPLAVERVFDEPVPVSGRAGAYSDHAGVLAEFEIGGPGSPAHRIPARSFALARDLLDNGRRRAERRRTEERVTAGASTVAAMLAVAATRRPGLSRRRFLRAALLTTAGAALSTATGLTVLSEHYVPRELSDFDAIGSLLAQIETRNGQRPSESPLPTVSLR